ncbi:MAG: sigma-70 family RNA polymerase sigma factor [Ardenticatenia bacterium]|nr:sigma-70 family RNA polymerase sigma factor [Ardenticatenia bacterium]
MSITKTRRASKPHDDHNLRGSGRLFVAVVAGGLLGVLWWASASVDSDDAGNSDLELIRRAQAGDVEAFNRLVGRYQRLAYNVAYRLTGDPDMAADATQEAFLAAYRALHAFGGGSFRAWLLRIVTNKCYDILRYHRRRPATSLDALVAQSAIPKELGRETALRPEEMVERLELAELLQAAIMELPEAQRVTLILADVHGFSYAEIADITGVELGTVKSRLNRARRRLRALLRRHEELLPPQYRLVGST